MANIKPIRSETDYEAALGRISELMDTESDSPEGDELDVLVDLVELYESKHVPMGYPNPIAAIEFRMGQSGLRPRDLVSFIGSRAMVSEVLPGKRAAVGEGIAGQAWHCAGDRKALAKDISGRRCPPAR